MRNNCGFSTVVTAIMAVLLVGCQTTPNTGSAGAPAQRTQVVVVATHHFITDQLDDYTPAHLRALLAKINPQVLAVEASADDTPDPWKNAPLDLAWVTRPWAQEHGIPIMPTGVPSADYPPQLAAMFDAFLAGGKDADYRRIEAEFQSATAAQRISCQSTNSREAQDIWRRYHASLHALYGRDTPWEQANARIVQNIIALCRQHPGQRIAVVFGGAHVYYIEDALSRESAIELLPAARFFPLADSDVAAQQRPIDDLLALRPLNLPTIAPEALPKLQEHLDRARKVREFAGDCYLFTGKLLMHRRQMGEAMAQFQAAAALDRGAISAFDGTTRLRESGIVNGAIVQMLSGEGDRARQDLERLLKEPDLSPTTRTWAQNVLNGISK